MALTWKTAETADTGDLVLEGSCLSTDEKPTEGVGNGSILLEMDTATLYFYDAANHEWRAWA